MTNEQITSAALERLAIETLRPSRERAWRMLDAGRLTVTISSADRHATFTFRPRTDRNDIRLPYGYWFSTGDGRYIGQLDTRDQARLVRTYRSLEDKAQQYAAGLVVAWLNGDDLTDVRGRAYTVAIANRCGRCGLKLKTPESIAVGLGPECERVTTGATSSRRSRPA